MKLKQHRPFQVRIPESYKRGLMEDSKKFGCHYGIFFDTSGKVHTEKINPTAQYEYLFRTDRPD